MAHNNFTGNPLKEIKKDIAHKNNTVGMLRVQTANETINEAKQLPDPVNLYDNIIYEGTMVCIFADTGLGKSLFAVQIGEDIAKKQPVIYLDCELSEKQFELRYRSEEGEYHIFPDSLFHISIEPGAIDAKNFEEAILISLVKVAEEKAAKILIIDNLTYLCNQSEKADIASTFMKRLKDLKDNGYTIIVIAHTPKLSPFRPISDCDLAGSRRLANFFDTMIAIGKSAKDPHIRYIKQVKGNRTAANKYDADNVLLCQIAREDNALRLVAIGTDKERNHLRILSDDEIDNMEANVRNLAAQGMSYREISRQLGLSKSSVGRIMNNELSVSNE